MLCQMPDILHNKLPHLVLYTSLTKNMTSGFRKSDVQLPLIEQVDITPFVTNLKYHMISSGIAKLPAIRRQTLDMKALLGQSLQSNYGHASYKIKSHRQALDCNGMLTTKHPALAEDCIISDCCVSCRQFFRILDTLGHTPNYLTLSKNWFCCKKWMSWQHLDKVT